jgi:hypothetical protein
MLRLTEDSDGNSHFDEISVPLAMLNAAPPAKPVYFSDPAKATHWSLCRCPVGWFGELHAAPRRQILVCTAGALRMTTSLGNAKEIGPGCAVLVEDTKGQGHESLVISAVPFDAIVIALE